MGLHDGADVPFVRQQTDGHDCFVIASGVTFWVSKGGDARELRSHGRNAVR
jgi:hypothetical protein